MNTRLLLVRHGQIDANLRQDWHGSTDSPLNSTGEQQAAMVAAHLRDQHRHAVALYASPLHRTMATAAAIGTALALPVQPEPGLREYGIGELEGSHYGALQREHGFYQRILTEPTWAPPGGESLAAVVERVCDAWQAIATRHGGAEQTADVVVVGHGAAMALALAQLLDGRPDAWVDYGIGNCSITELHLAPAPRVARLNASSHLDGA